MTHFLRVSPRLPVRDLLETAAWYSRVLGFEAGDPWPAESPTFVLLDRESTGVQFYLPANRDVPVGEATLSFDVSDAQALHDALATEIAIEWGPEVYWYGRREFAIRDPNGYLLIFSEETSDPPTCAE